MFVYKASRLGSDEKPQRGNTLAKMEPRVVERGGMTLHLWEEPSDVRWALDYKGCSPPQRPTQPPLNCPIN